MYLKIFAASVTAAGAVLLWFIYRGGDFSRELWIVAIIFYLISSMATLIFFYLNKELINEIVFKNKPNKVIDLIFGINKK